MSLEPDNLEKYCPVLLDRHLNIKLFLDTFVNNLPIGVRLAAPTDLPQLRSQLAGLSSFVQSFRVE